MLMEFFLLFIIECCSVYYKWFIQAQVSTQVNKHPLIKNINVSGSSKLFLNVNLFSGDICVVFKF